MVRFSCFHSHIHGQKTKKQAQPSFETMIKMLQVGSQSEALLSSKNPGSLDQSPSDVKSNCDSVNEAQSSQVNYLVGCSSKIGEINSDSSNTRTSPMRQFRRSLSLGCNLHEGRIFEENNSDECTDRAFSCDGSHDQQNHVPTAVNSKSPVATITDEDQEDASVGLLHFSCTEVNNGSILSIGYQQYSEKEVPNNFNILVNGEAAVDSGIHTPQTPPMIAKSSSLPNLLSMLSRSEGCFPFNFSAHRNRSSEDINVLMMRKETCVHDLSMQQFPGHIGDYLYKSDKYAGQNGVPDGCDDSYKYAASNRDWIVPALDDEVYGPQTFQGESSNQQDQLPNEDFKMKRIEEWVTDLQECSPVEEISDIQECPVEEKREMPASRDQGSRISVAKEEANLNPSMLAAKRYISSLSASASAAQLANLGLTVIPFLSAFVSLKVVNLSGNSIVRITAGALPRGLHMLNLSKNKISAIEGLRELTRLRILDLSYNRITRIGHGLASCSSLKELYLAGNKISEVEGLHRLLKLAVLDLRFNKISTSKCLGQLAANYNSLQAISLEGNPAQKNVGDEHLKKYLQGLLPHLAYYNRQTIKSSSVKDSADRSVRLGMAAHQFDRSHKSDHKSSRRASHSSVAVKQSSVHGHGHKGQVVDSPKLSRSKHGHLPLTGTRTSHRRHHHQPPLELSMKPLVLPDFGMKKSQSVGALAAL